MNTNQTVDYADSVNPVKTTNVDGDFISWEEFRSDDVDSIEEINSGTQSVEKYGSDILLSNPEDVNDLPKQWHLHYALREANRDELNEWEERSPEEEARINRLFDQSVLERTKRALEEEGVDVEALNLPVKRVYLYGLVLQTVRKLKYRPFYRHLEEHTETAEKLYGDRPRSRRTLNGKGNEITSQRDDEYDYIDSQTIENAALRILYGLYRKGDDIPASVWEKHVDSEDERSPLYLQQKIGGSPDGSQIPEPVHDEGVANWIRLFFDHGLFEPLNLQRDDSIVYPFEAIIGLIAHSALHNTALGTGSRTCAGWIEDYDVVPGEGAFSDQIVDLHIDTIERKFQEANRILLKIAAENGVFDTSKRVAFDPTRLLEVDDDASSDWLKGHAYETIGEVESSDVDNQLHIGLTGFINKDIYLLLGSYPIASEKKNIGIEDSLERTLRPALTHSPVNIDEILMDREMSKGVILDHTRGLLGEDFLILGTKPDKVQEVIDNIDEDEEDRTRFMENADIDGFGHLSEKPHVYIFPIPEGSSHTDDSYLALLTDKTKEEIESTNAFHLYQTRARIEPSIDGIKNDFSPRTYNCSAERAFYYTNIAILFFNIKNLINSCLSPEYRLPLGEGRNVRSREVLSAIREVAFERAKQAD